ncbi:hypothetical protein [Salinicola sp. CPA57]|uniref:hypothetical protein n=1 Tax=Salinicola sp. CPA57 TaxID=1949080 RepID=UPI0018E4FE9C|nr:hypothetical protein [Salinicola sp. CPA57]
MRLIEIVYSHRLFDERLPREIFGPLGFDVHTECHEPPIDPEDIDQEAFETYARSPDSYIASLPFEVPAGFGEAVRYESEDCTVLLALKPLTPLAELLLAQEETAAPLAAIAHERRRQVEAEGWTVAHDDAYAEGMLLAAGCCYANRSVEQLVHPHLAASGTPIGWPWHDTWWKPSDNAGRNLEKAGALTLAEMERLARAEQRAGGAV